MENLYNLLNKIEECSKDAKVTLKDKLIDETERMYSYYALKNCIDRLSNKDTSESKEGLQRTKAYFDKIGRLDF